MAVLTRTISSTLRQTKVAKAKVAATIQRRATHCARHVPRRQRLMPRFSRPIPPTLEAFELFFLDVLAEVGIPALRSIMQTSIVLDSPFGDLSIASLPVRCAGILPPTHILGLHAPRSSHVSFLPVHADVLATYCTDLPCLTEPTCDLPPSHLPVQFLCVPHPESFGLLIQYFYSRRQDVLYKALSSGPQMFSSVPNAVSDVGIASAARESHVSESSMAFLEGLWKNVRALGVHDDGLWEVIQVAERVHLAALSF